MRVGVQVFQSNEASRDDVVAVNDDRLIYVVDRFLLSDDSIFYANYRLCVSMFSITYFGVLFRLFFLLIVRVFRFELFRYSDEICGEEVEGDDRRGVKLICSYIRYVLYFGQVERGDFDRRYLVFFHRATLSRYLFCG